MSQHTPGPWKTGAEYQQRIEVYVLVSEPGRPGMEHLVAEVASHDGFPPGEQGEANARLIVAAPDLLVAAEDALRYFRDNPQSDYLFAGDLASAVARAKGETP